MREPSIREFALLQTAALLRRLAFQVNRAAKNGDSDSIHDLRVALRRFSRALRVFSQFYPAGSWKSIRRQLADLMDVAARVRDRDIALELLAESGIRARSAIVSRLDTERRQASHELGLELRRLRSRNFSRKWRSQLELQP
jgi:CHAD domain-containing protein